MNAAAQARDTMLGVLAQRAIDGAENEELSFADRRSALLRYPDEELRFIRSQPKDLRPLIRPPTSAQRARMAELLAELKVRVAEEEQRLERARPSLYRERAALIDRIAPPVEKYEEEVVREGAAILQHIQDATVGVLSQAPTAEEIAAFVEANRGMLTKYINEFEGLMKR